MREPRLGDWVVEDGQRYVVVGVADAQKVLLRQPATNAERFLRRADVFTLPATIDAQWLHADAASDVLARVEAKLDRVLLLLADGGKS